MQLAKSSKVAHKTRVGTGAVSRATIRPAPRSRQLRATITPDQIPPEALAIGGGVIASILGLVGFSLSQGGSMTPDAAAGQQEAGVAAAPVIPRENAVLVFGATGRMGRKIVEQLVRSGRTVVAAARSADKAAEVFAEAGLQMGYQQAGGAGGILLVDSGVDVTNPDTLTANLFRGVTQVVSALGPVFGRLPEGGMGYFDNMSPERVDAQGNTNIAAAMAQHMDKQAPSSQVVLPMATADDLAKWERLDDVIMGGISDSALAPAPDGSGALWSGTLRVEGGGFCGQRSVELGMDLSAFDGVQLRVRGDGQTFKLNVKTEDQANTPESTYQATFDTSPEGDWTTVRLPWHNFVPVKRAQSDPEGGPLDPSSISKLGLVLSRFEFNKMPNPSYRAGPFTLELAGGVAAYTAPRPQLVAISSAGVERNAIIGDDADARKRDIPIVQLNPGGVLNWKYEGECAARAAGFPYTVLRCTGLDDTAGGTGPALLEADQGDSISGKVSRDEAAALVAFLLSSAEAAGKTFELRRSEAFGDQGRGMGPREYTRLLLKLAPDAHRWRVGLRPMPKAVPPPAPASEERVKEILADPRVQEVAARDRRARGEAGGDGGQQQQQAAGGEQAAAEKEVVSANA